MENSELETLLKEEGAGRVGSSSRSDSRPKGGFSFYNKKRGLHSH